MLSRTLSRDLAPSPTEPSTSFAHVGTAHASYVIERELTVRAELEAIVANCLE